MRNINQKKPERGAVIVEFALVLPLLLLLLFGIIEFGLLFYNKQVLTNASREGARAGIARVDVTSIDVDNPKIAVLLTESNIDDVVEQYCEKRLITFGAVPVVNTTVEGLGGGPQEELKVTANYGYDFLIPGLLGFGTDIQLSAETVMLMERELE